MDPNHEALRHLSEWSQNDQSFIEAVEIIQTTDLPGTLMFCTSLIKNKLINLWGKISWDQRQSLRSILFSKINNISNDCILEQITIAISEIALLDWPEEWTSFPTDLSLFNLSHHLLILSSFLHLLNDPNLITENRRDDLRQQIILLSQTFLNPILLGFTNNLIDLALKSLAPLFSWFPIDQTPPDLLPLILNYLSDPNLIVFVIQCLRNAFLDRADFDAAYSLSAPYIILSISNSYFPSKLHCCSHPEALSFITSFLSKYGTSLELQSVGIDVDENSQITNNLITIPISEQNDHYETVSCDNLKQAIINLYGIILTNNPGDDEESDFWPLWSDISRRIAADIQNKNHFLDSIFINLVSLMRQSFLEKLPKAIDENGIIFPDAKICWHITSTLDPNGCLELLRTLPPSIELLYGLSCLEIQKEFSPEVTVLFENCFEQILAQSQSQTQAISVVFAELYSGSRLITYLNSPINFINFILKYLKIPDTSYAAIKALDYSYLRLPQLFFEENCALGSFLIKSLEAFLNELPFEASYESFALCCQIFLQMPLNVSDTLINDMRDPLANDLNSNNLDLIKRALGAISEGCKRMRLSCHRLIEICNPIVINLLLQYNSEELIINDIVFTTIEIIRNSLWDEEFTKNVIINIPSPELGFEFIKNVRNSHNEAEMLWEIVENNLILPGIEEFTSSGDSNILNLIIEVATEFNSSIESPWLIDVIAAGINDLSNQINYSTFNLIDKITQTLKTEDSQRIFDFYNKAGVLITELAFKSLTDGFHKDSFDSISETIRILFVGIGGLPFEKEFYHELINYLKENIREPGEGFFGQFIDYLACSYATNTNFKRACHDFVILLKKRTKIDSGIFNINPLMNCFYYAVFDDISICNQIEDLLTDEPFLGQRIDENEPSTVPNTDQH